MKLTSRRKMQKIVIQESGYFIPETHRIPRWAILLVGMLIAGLLILVVVM
jgi:hypothetical protein